MAASSERHIASALDTAARLLDANPREAERLARQAWSGGVMDPRVALILGSARRRLGDYAGARALLEPLAAAFPRAVNTQFELGATFTGLGDLQRAKAAFRTVLGLKPDHTEAWRKLGRILFQEGDAAGADRAFAEAERASVTDPRLRSAVEALSRGDFASAETRLRSALKEGPDNAAALRLLGETYLRSGAPADAEVLLARAVELDATLEGARFSLATALFHQQKGLAAAQIMEDLVARDPEEPAYRNLLAASLSLVGDFQRVLTLYEGLLQDYARQPRLWLNYGHALRTVGRLEEAVRAYRRSIGLAPTLGDAYWSLANLKVVKLTDSEIEAMLGAAADPSLPEEDLIHTEYALGKAYEDEGEFQTAFIHYARGAQRRKAQLAYDPSETEAHASRTKAVFTRAYFAERKDAGAASTSPIFIVGLPRAGSTLVEQILASHSEVEGTMELPDIGLIARDLHPTPKGSALPYPDSVAALTPEQLRALGEAYLSQTAVHRQLGRKRFIDKMPNNFLHMGLILSILPGSSVIDVRRHPMASCFAAFKQHFAQGQAFSYDLNDLGRYYRSYIEIMRHFDEVFPGRIIRIIYEDLISDTDRSIQDLLAKCNLHFEPQCLEFWKTERAVRTVSSEQVRMPIFRDGLDRWRQFEPWLSPLKAALGPALDRWRD